MCLYWAVTLQNVITNHSAYQVAIGLQWTCVLFLELTHTGGAYRWVEYALGLGLRIVYFLA
jgi:fatty-acid desaturase